MIDIIKKTIILLKSKEISSSQVSSNILNYGQPNGQIYSNSNELQCFYRDIAKYFIVQFASRKSKKPFTAVSGFAMSVNDKIDDGNNDDD